VKESKERQWTKALHRNVLLAAGVGESANVTRDMPLVSEECGKSPQLAEMKCRCELALQAFSLGNSEPLKVFVHSLSSL